MRIITLVLLLTTAALLDGTVTARLAIGTTRTNTVVPDAFLIALIAWLLLNRGTWALAGACAIGLACDLSAASRLGIVMMVYVSAGLACCWCDEHWPQSRFGRIGTRLAVALGVPLALAIALKLTGDVSTAWWMLVWRALAVGAFSLTLALPVALAMHWCRELLDGEARGSKHSAAGPYLGNRRGTTF